MHRVECAREDIRVGSRWVLESDGLLELLPKSASFLGIVTDMSVEALAAQPLAARLRAAGRHEVAVFVLPDGESSKGRQWKELVEEWLFACRAGKNSCLLAVGGGVVGDLTGFVAATYLRGIPFVQVPTTLLAMVDSAIGGKTAIDVAAGKNLVGSFNHPAVVAIDTALLETLPVRQLCNGMAEVIKVAAALDAPFFEWLERPDVAKLLCEARDPGALLRCVRQSAQLKARLVDEDERDGARRNILNLGHTLGHALEACLAPAWLHGECVAVGMVAEAHAALEAGVLTSSAAIERLRRVLKLYRLPFAVPYSLLRGRTEELLAFAQADKKATARGEVRCVLLAGVGSVGAQVTYAVPHDTVRALVSPAVAIVPLPASGAAGAVAVCVPGSKSVSNRILLLAGLGAGTTVVSGLLHAADTYVSLEALSVLGVQWSWNAAGSQLRIDGSAGKLNVEKNAHIFLDNAGTASRFLTACATWLPPGQSVTLRGAPRMHERPIRPLVEALVASGARIDYLGREGHFPLLVHGGGGLSCGAEVALDSSVSSQFTSAVLLAGCKGGVRLRLTGKLISQPYVRMTIALMRQFGIAVTSSPDFTEHAIPDGCYANPPAVAVEADASSATYPLAIAALTGRRVTVTNIGSDSLQGDARFAFLLQQMGCHVEQTATATTVEGPRNDRRLVCIPEVDMADQTDAFLTMAVLAACSEGSCRIVGIANQRVKECNRIAAVAEGLRACGIAAEELPDGIQVTGNAAHTDSRALIRCFNDHRVAMSFAVLGCVRPNIVLLDKACVDKTFPNFWHMLKSDFGVKAAAASEWDLSQEQPPLPPQHAMPRRRRIVLIGMRGAGKTTLGAELAQWLGVPCVDADVEFVTVAGCAPREFVAHSGMESFRATEATVLKELLASGGDRVVACGGGVVETTEGRALLQEARSSWLMVHIRRDWASLSAFLAGDAQRVPLAEPLTDTWARRLPHYEALAHVEYFWSADIPAVAVGPFVERVLCRGFWPQWRLGPGTSFECLNVRSYKGLPAGTCPADAVELRVDELADCSEEAVRAELAWVRGSVRRGVPVVFTVRSVAQGGRWRGSQEQYAALVRIGIASACELVDVEACWSSAMGELVRAASRDGCGFIFSDHRMTTRPTLTLLKDMAMGCRRVAPSVPALLKLVCLGAEPGDCDVMRDFARGPFGHICHAESPGFILLLVGAAGRLSRVQNALLTPCASVLSEAPAAPGQYHAGELKRIRSELGLGQAGKVLLFGKPISASRSPAMQNAGFAYFALPLEYALCETDSAEAMRVALASPECVGANVTIPLKEDALRLVQVASDSARQIGAVNTVWKTRDGRLCGDNTDWRGVVELCKAHGPFPRAVVIGAGGTARAAVFAALQLGATSVSVWNRTHARAAELQRQFGARCVAVDSLAAVAAADFVISCVPKSAEGIVLPREWQPKCFLNCAYGVANDPIAAQLPESCHVVDGIRLLLEQGLWAWRIWCARDPPRPAMEEALKQ